MSPDECERAETREQRRQSRPERVRLGEQRAGCRMEHAQQDEEDRRLRDRRDVGRHEARCAFVDVRRPGVEGCDRGPGDEPEHDQREPDVEGEPVLDAGARDSREIESAGRAEDEGEAVGEDQAREDMSEEGLEARLARRKTPRVDRHQRDHRQPGELDRHEEHHQVVRHDRGHRARPREEQQRDRLRGATARHAEMGEREREDEGAGDHDEADPEETEPVDVEDAADRLAAAPGEGEGDAHQAHDRDGAEADAGKGGLAMPAPVAATEEIEGEDREGAERRHEHRIQQAHRSGSPGPPRSKNTRPTRTRSSPSDGSASSGTSASGATERRSI